jgi:predicted Rossmann fold nucleotide-binding protein DprA/Smf involved in DNA uptake
LNSQPQHIDEIHLRAGLPIAQVSSLLAMLELKGLAQHVGGMQYVAIREEGALYQ